MRAALRLLACLVLVALAAAGGAWFYLAYSLPRLEGEIAVEGISAPVEILRDTYGIPHIFAASLEDAQFALGFVHAQDRLWQMEMNRRIGSGRLAEVLGPRALEADRFLRTLGVRRAAQANLRRYDEETLRQLSSYAAGVNAFLDSKPVLPPEFWILGVRPEPWSAVDSVVWTKMMAWDLGGNWRNELLRMRLAKTLPPERIQEFLAPYPGDAPVELPDDLKSLYAKWGSDPDLKMGSVPVFSSLGFGGGASNSWAVSGARSSSGKPLLANDPHLGLTAPPVWYFAQLTAPGIDAIGATLPGVPGILLGRNDRIAWGFTNTGPDVQDFYLERGDAGLRVIEERIRVKGGADEVLEVRVSRHGPVISDVSRAAREATPEGHALALAWTALAEDDLTMQAGLSIARARNWREFVDALRDFHAPQQNITYADVEGNIGFIAPGRVPVRKRANALAGLAPAPGWDPRFDWAGFIPFDELPRRLNPPSGTVVSANQKITPPGYAHHITSEWQAPYRARRIEELLAAVPAHNLGSSARMQLDVVSLAMRELLPHLLKAKANTEEATEALHLLAGWDGTMAAGRPEPLIAVAWWRELARALYADELGEAFRGAWDTRAVFMANALANRGGQAHWCDDTRSPEKESCTEILSSSLERALQDLRERYGDDPREWRWGEAHEARLAHRPFSRSEWLGRFFDIAVPSPGDGYTLNVGRSDFSNDAAPYANRHAASLRAIYDLADPQASLFIHPGGQSGNPLSEHYASFTGAWARGDYVPMVTDRARLEAAGVQRLVLTPRR